MHERTPRPFIRQIVWTTGYVATILAMCILLSMWIDPANGSVWGFGWLALILAWFRFRAIEVRMGRWRAGRCVNCGYDMRATPGRCPECGIAVQRQPASNKARG